MKFTLESLESLCVKGIQESYMLLKNLGEKGRTELHDDHVVDIATEADVAISKHLIQYFKDSKVPAILYSEENAMNGISEAVHLCENPQYTIVFDDIDGTKNYHSAPESLPHMSLITLFDSPEPTFKDALVAVMIDHVSGKLFCATRSNGAYSVYKGKRESLATSQKTQLSKRGTRVAVDLYQADTHLSRFAKLNTKAWLNDYGASAYHQVGVAAGIFDGFVTFKQKGHELSAGYLFMQEAGGCVTDLNGNSIDDARYDFNAHYQVILGATEEITKEIQSLL